MSTFENDALQQIGKAHKNSNCVTSPFAQRRNLRSTASPANQRCLQLVQLLSHFDSQEFFCFHMWPPGVCSGAAAQLSRGDQRLAGAHLLAQCHLSSNGIQPNIAHFPLSHCLAALSCQGYGGGLPPLNNGFYCPLISSKLSSHEKQAPEMLLDRPSIMLCCLKLIIIAFLSFTIWPRF